MNEFAEPPLNPEVEYALLQSDFQERLAREAEVVITGKGTILVHAGTAPAEDGDTNIVLLTEFTPRQDQQASLGEVTRQIKIIDGKGHVRILDVPLDPENKDGWTGSTANIFADTRKIIQDTTFNQNTTADFVRLFRDIFGEPTVS